MMPGKAVFLDRDDTLIEDTGFLSDPSGVKLLPGVEMALKSLAQAGYKTVLVTNQSGVARGVLSEETLGLIHAEMSRQLEKAGARLDGIYYCPCHPDGTVEKYAVESDLRKPAPGMLLQAAEDLDIDLSKSWMVGDRAGDVEAGRRAGCRTIRIRSRARTDDAETGDEDVQPDCTVRNLVDAARVILRGVEGGGAAMASADAEHGGAEVGAAAPSRASDRSRPAGPRLTPASAGSDQEPMSDSHVRLEILRHLKQIVRADQTEEFSLTKLTGGIVQMLALLTLLICFVRLVQDRYPESTIWALIAIMLQVITLTLFMTHRSR